MANRDLGFSDRSDLPTLRRIPLSHPAVSAEVAVALSRLWRQLGPPEVIVCIGTDRATGDALGPLVGTYLGEVEGFPVPIVGNLEEPIHAVNLRQWIESRSEWRTRRLLAIDASLGKPEEVGMLSVGLGPLRPGAGVNKDLPALGTYFVTGTVNVGGFLDYFVLQNTRLSLVMKMARAISVGLQQSFSML